MKTAVVYTADVGRYDDVHRPVDQDLPSGWTVEWRYLAGEYRDRRLSSKGWSYLALPNLPDYWPIRLVATWPKYHPHVLFPDADLTIWVDASLEITSPSFVWDVVRHASLWDQYVMFEHPDRANVYEEIEAADSLPRARGTAHGAMVRRLEAIQGPPPGLWACGFIGRRSGPLVRLTDHLVWSTVVSWTIDQAVPSDQLVFPFAVDWTEAPVVPAVGVGSLWANSWFVRHPHRWSE